VKTVVRFRARHGMCAIPMEYVVGVRRATEVRPFPGQRDDVLGLIGLDGGTVPVLKVLSSEGRFVMLLKTAAGPCGLLVDEVVGVVRLADTQLQPPPAGRAEPLLEAVIRTDGDVDFLISADELARRLTPDKKVSRSLPAVSRRMAEELPLRLLLVEDNAVVQTATRRLLAKMGYAIDVANAARQAIDAMERRAYDLVFMDVQMPDMNGIEAMQEITRRWPSARPAVVALSAGETEAERKACLDAGMNDFLLKPVREATLSATLRKWGQKRPAEAGA
jgi:CheY-like chemotaxis protein/chemotaxis signal transduction protein